MADPDSTQTLNLSAREAAGGGAATYAPIPPDALIIVPVRNAVLFPEQVMPITVGRPKSIAAAQQAMREQRPVGILMQREANVADPVPIDMHRFGTVANVVRFLTAPDGTHHLVAQGEQRFRVGVGPLQRLRFACSTHRTGLCLCVDHERDAHHREQREEGDDDEQDDALPGFHGLEMSGSQHGKVLPALGRGAQH